jgi:hypothetical protein
MVFPMSLSWRDEQIRVMGRAVRPEGGVLTDPEGSADGAGVAVAVDFPGVRASDNLLPLSWRPLITYNI